MQYWGLPLSRRTYNNTHLNQILKKILEKKTIMLPAPPSGVIVPSLTLTRWPVVSKCFKPWPLPPTPPYCCLPHPRQAQVRQSQRFSFWSHWLQCARPAGGHYNFYKKHRHWGISTESRNRSRFILFERKGMLARCNLLFPCLDFRLTSRWQGLHHAINEGLYLCLK